MNNEYRIRNNKSGRKIPVPLLPIPEGLHVYSKPVSRENSTPMGVVPGANVWCYKYMMPLASGRTGLPKKEKK